jgi:hypothetical protein
VEIDDGKKVELIFRGRSDRCDRHPVEGNNQPQNLAPMSLAERFVKGEALPLDERVERSGMAVLLDEAAFSFRRNRRNNETAPEGPQVDGRLEGLPKVKSERRESRLQCAIPS